MLFTHTKPASHESRLLSELKKNRHYGVFNYILARPSVGGLGYRGRISALRKDGYGISAIRISTGIFKYYLVSEPEQ